MLLPAMIVAWFIFAVSVKVFKMATTSATYVAITVLIMQILFKITPDKILQTLNNLPQALWQIGTN
jgi:uncharacterized ion transporter superfamily protein YfcC